MPSGSAEDSDGASSHTTGTHASEISGGTQLTDLTELTEEPCVSDTDDSTHGTLLTDTESEVSVVEEQVAKRARTAEKEHDKDEMMAKFIAENLEISFDRVGLRSVLLTRRAPLGNSLRTKHDAVRAINAWFGMSAQNTRGHFEPFRADRAGNRDSQQLRRQSVGTVTLYFNWGGEDVEVGLRAKSKDASSPQRPLVLRPCAGIVIGKTTCNSVLVSLVKGDRSKFWAFELNVDDEYDEAGDGAQAAREAEHGEEEMEKEAEEEEERARPQEKVAVKSLASLHQYQGLKGFVDGARGNKVWVVFPCGAPPKAFLPDHLVPADVGVFFQGLDCRASSLMPGLVRRASRASSKPCSRTPPG